MMRNTEKHRKGAVAAGDNVRHICTNCGITYLEMNQLPLCSACLKDLNGYLMFARDAAHAAEFKPGRFQHGQIPNFLG